MVNDEVSYILTPSLTTFDQAWKAAGFSSNMDDYFDVEVAKFVGFGGNTVVQDIDYSEDTYIYEDTDADTEEWR